MPRVYGLQTSPTGLRIPEFVTRLNSFARSRLHAWCTRGRFGGDDVEPAVCVIFASTTQNQTYLYVLSTTWLEFRHAHYCAFHAFYRRFTTYDITVLKKKIIIIGALGTVSLLPALMIATLLLILRNWSDAFRYRAMIVTTSYYYIVLYFLRWINIKKKIKSTCAVWCFASERIIFKLFY